MSETQTQTNPSETQSPQDKVAIKAAKMAAYAEKHLRIEAGKAAVKDLEKDASDYAETVIKDFGLGPHKMTVNGTVKIVQFQRVAKTVRAHILDLDSVT